MDKEAIINSVIATQAKLIEVKNDEIAGLISRLKDSAQEIEELTNKLNASAYEILIDQSYDRACRIVEASLKELGIKYEGKTLQVNEGDSVNLYPEQISQIQIAGARRLLTYTVMPYDTPELQETLQDLARDVANQISSLALAEVVFFQLPRPMKGCGALSNTRPLALGGRFVVNYDPMCLRTQVTFQLGFAGRA